MPIRRRNLSDLKLFNEFSEEKERNIENIPAAELQQLAKKFVLVVRKKNGEEYEPSSLRGFFQSVDRYLRKKGCTFSLLNDNEFCEVQDILKKKQKQLKAIGKGNKANSADAITDEEIEDSTVQKWSEIKHSLDEQLYLFRYDAWTRATRSLLGRFGAEK